MGCEDEGELVEDVDGFVDCEDDNGAVASFDDTPTGTAAVPDCDSFAAGAENLSDALESLLSKCAIGSFDESETSDRFFTGLDDALGRTGDNLTVATSGDGWFAATGDDWTSGTIGDGWLAAADERSLVGSDGETNALPGDDASPPEEAFAGFKAAESSAGLGVASDFVGRIGDGDATSDVLIRRSGVLEGEEGDRDTEEDERADAAATGEDDVVTGEDDPVKTGEDDFDKLGSEDDFDKTGEEEASFAGDPAVALFAYVCGTGSRITSDEWGVSSPRATRFAFPNSLDEVGRFSALVSSAADCWEEADSADFPARSCFSSRAAGEGEETPTERDGGGGGGEGSQPAVAAKHGGVAAEGVAEGGEEEGEELVQQRVDVFERTQVETDGRFRGAEGGQLGERGEKRVTLAPRDLKEAATPL